MSVAPTNAGEHTADVYQTPGTTIFVPSPTTPVTVNPADLYACLMSGRDYASCVAVSRPATPTPASSAPSSSPADTGPCAGKGIIGMPLCQIGQAVTNITGVLIIAVIAILLIVGLALVVQ